MDRPDRGRRAPFAGLIARTINTARGIQLRRNWSKGLADLDDFRRAGEALNRAPPTCLRVLVCHHPLMEVIGEPITAEVRRGKQAAAILAEHKVDLVVTGHLHVPFAVTLPWRRAHALGGGSTMRSASGVDRLQRHRGRARRHRVPPREGRKPSRW